MVSPVRYSARRWCERHVRRENYQVVNTTTGKPASFPMLKKDAEVSAARMNAHDQENPRAILAARANALGRESRRRGAPVLTHESTAEEVAAWLQWCDPNGWHTAPLAIAEGCDPYDLDRAWEALAAMLEGS